MPYVGEIRLFAGNFPPLGWELCQGQLMPISENETLFQLIGTTYGGDAQETFALPDLRGRVPIHYGTGLSGTTYTLGQASGTETVTLISNNLPQHQHLVGGPVAIAAFGANPGTLLPASNNYAAITSGATVYSTNNDAVKRLAPLQVAPDNGTNMMTVQPTGNNQPKENMQPFLAVNYIISMFGVFPSP